MQRLASCLALLTLATTAACGGGDSHGAEQSAAGGLPSMLGGGGGHTGGGAPAIGGSTATGGTGATGGSGTGGGSTGTGGSGAGGVPPVDPPPRPPDVANTLAPMTIEAGDEVTGLCQSWTVGNDTSLFVNAIVETNEGGLHHSNWIWVNESSYPGPDGTWPCAERGFEQISAAAFGGVFFAQSTQARQDVQRFPDGVAYELPPHSKIIGDVHLLNATPDAVTTSVRFEMYTLPEAAVQTRLQPMAFTNTVLDIAPLMETHARMQCATPQPDFDIYYVLPHFHELGNSLRIDVAGGPADGLTVFQSMGAYGEAMGQTFDPPISVRGALGLGITCEYENPRSATVGYGVGDQEMCVALIYATGKKAGGTTISNLTVMDTGNVHETDALCLAVGSP